MSSPFHSNHQQHNNNYQGGSGGGGGGQRSNNYRGGGGGGRFGQGRSSSRGGGRWNNNNNNNQGGGGRGGRGGGGSGGQGGGGGDPASVGIIRPCLDWTRTSTCPRGDTCSFGHNVVNHAVVDASTLKPQQQQQANATNNNGYHNNNNNNNNRNTQPQMYDVSSISIWDQNGAIKIFTGSHDGFWRLWNTTGGNFIKEFENNMNGKVYTTAVVNNFLFCAFEAVSRTLPDVPVGMVHLWNLQQPSAPPLELHMGTPYLPYASGQAVTVIDIVDTAATDTQTPAGTVQGQTPSSNNNSNSINTTIIASGSKDGSIRIWMFSPTENKFVLSSTLHGHSREITGLVLLPSTGFLWSSSIDGCIRIWSISKGECQYCITRDTPAGGVGAPPSATSPQQQQQQQAGAATGVGHTNAITSLLKFDAPGGAGTFILSSSLDKSIKVWNASSGECVASEWHTDGVVCMCLGQESKKGIPVLLIGLESGNIQCRNLLPSGTISTAFTLLFTLSGRYTVGHTGPVRCITAGPASTFYSGGSDGKMLVFSFTGDLGL